VLSRQVMILVAMSAEVTWFEILRKKYESCPDFGEIYIMLRVLIERWTDFCYMMNIYLDSVSYVLHVRPSEILSWDCMMEIWHDFDQNKTIETIEHRFYWSSMKKDTAKIVGQYRTFQLAKQQK